MPEPTPDRTHACLTCGPTATEPHPRLPIDRCSNCKEHITPGAARTTMGDGAGCARCGHSEGEGCGCPPNVSLRDRYCEEIIRLQRQTVEQGGFGMVAPGVIADAVLNVRDTKLEQLRREHAALKRARIALVEQAGRNQAALARVRALRTDWLSAGAPPLGTSIARWWDKRLIELAAALDQPQEQP